MGIKDRPMRFIDEMVKAILSGQKTVTRRVIKDQPGTTEQRLRELGAWVEGLTLSQHVNQAWQAGFIPVECPYGQPGDRLLVRDEILLEITSVSVERVQDIGEEQAWAEGFEWSGWAPSYSNPDNANFEESLSARDNFAKTWGEIYGNWQENPWVWVIKFKRVTPCE